MKNLFLGILCALTLSFITNPSSAQTDSVKTATIKVGNLHCDNDMPTIKKRLLNQDGIDDVAFTDRDEDVSVFTISYHTAATSEAGIVKAVESTPGCDDQTETPYKVIKERPRKKKKG